MEKKFLWERRVRTSRGMLKEQAVLNAGKLGDRIRLLRQAHGQTQDHLAQVLSISGPSVHQWEKNQTKPTLENLRKIAEHFKLGSLSWLAENKGRPPDKVVLYVYGKSTKLSPVKTEEFSPVLDSIGFISELAAHPVPQEPENWRERDWRIPPNALPRDISPERLTVVRSPIELAAIEVGDYLIVDCGQQSLDAPGFWVVRIENVGGLMPVLVAANVQATKLSFEYFSFGDSLSIPRDAVKEVIGRVIARYTSLYYP